MFSADFDLDKRHIPQSIIASSSSLHSLRGTLDQLSLLYSVASPLVAHVSAVDYAPGSRNSVVTDYSSALSIAEELGLALVCSRSPHEIQHMALFSTLLARTIPALHIYDALATGRDTTRVVDVLDQRGLYTAYKTIQNAASSINTRNEPIESKVSRTLKALNGELGTDYQAFEYHGHDEADTVLVTFGSVESSLASQIGSLLASSGQRVGVISVRIYRPFLEEAFIKFSLDL